MSYVDDRETFFSPDKDTAMSHGMTAQYLNECVDKYIGLAVVDRESDTWGWVHDQHKNESGWVMGETHDDRIQELRDGAHIKPALPAEYEKYEFVEETDPTETTCADYTEHMRAYANGGMLKDESYATREEVADRLNHWGKVAKKTATSDHTEGSIHTPASFTEGMEAHISDPVNPDHYRSHPSGVECIQITEHMNFNLGNTIKYVWRAGLKTDDPAEDIKKALWYLRRELSRIEAES